MFGISTETNQLVSCATEVQTILVIYQSSPVNQCNMFVRMNYDTSRVICVLTNSELLIIMSIVQAPFGEMCIVYRL